MDLPILQTENPVKTEIYALSLKRIPDDDQPLYWPINGYIQVGDELDTPFFVDRPEGETQDVGIRWVERILRFDNSDEYLIELSSGGARFDGKEAVCLSGNLVQMIWLVHLRHSEPECGRQKAREGMGSKESTPAKNILVVRRDETVNAIDEQEFAAKSQDVFRDATQGVQTVVTEQGGKAKALIGMNGNRFLPDYHDDSPTVQDLGQEQGT